MKNTINTVSALAIAKQADSRLTARTAIQNTLMTATAAAAMLLMTTSASAAPRANNSGNSGRLQHNAANANSQRHVNIYNPASNSRTHTTGSASGNSQRHVNIYNPTDTGRHIDHSGSYSNGLRGSREHHEPLGRFVGHDKFGRRIHERTVIRYGRPVIEYVPEVEVGYAQPVVPVAYPVAPQCDTCAPVVPAPCEAAAPPPPPPPPPVDCGCQPVATPMAYAAATPVYAVPTTTVVRTRVIVRGHGRFGGYGRRY